MYIKCFSKIPDSGIGINYSSCQILQGVSVKNKSPLFKVKNNLICQVKGVIHKKPIITEMPNMFKHETSTVIDFKIINELLEDNCYCISQKTNDTFVGSVMTTLIDDFNLIQEHKKTKQQSIWIKKFKQKLALDLNYLDLYRKFNYHHNHKFKKSKLEMNLNSDLVVSENEMKFIADYFDLNILVLDVKTKLLNISRKDIYSNKLSILLIYKNNKYLPVLSDSGNHFIHPEQLKKILKKYKINQLDVSNKKTNKLFKKVEISKKNYKQNKLSLYNINKYTLRELQEIAEGYDIDIHKLKTNKKGLTLEKPKTKKELYDIIKTKHGV